MEQLPMNLTPPTGRQLADEGMQRTLEAEREEWISAAMEGLRTFGAMPGWREFKTEDFRAWYEGSGGGSAPHDHHVWGALTNRAARAGIIRFTGRFAPSSSPKTHHHPVKIWSAA